MKVFKILSRIFQICAAVLFLASLVVCGIMPEELPYMTTMVAFVGVFALGVVGIFLLSAQSDVAKRIGHGFVISSFGIGLTAAIGNMTIVVDGEETTSIAAILMLVAAILLAFYYLCELVVSIIRRSGSYVESPDEDVRITRVKEWKSLMEEGIISEEEYEEKRCQILGIKVKKNTKVATKEAPVTEQEPEDVE